jgi:hypothetical protein
VGFELFLLSKVAPMLLTINMDEREAQASGSDNVKTEPTEDVSISIVSLVVSWIISMSRRAKEGSSAVGGSGRLREIYCFGLE